MTIRLFHFPLLVYRNIVQQIGISDTCALGTCSKKTRLIVQKCLSPLKFKMDFTIDTKFSARVARCYSNGDSQDGFMLTVSNGNMQGRRGVRYQCWKLSDQVSLYVNLNSRGEGWHHYIVNRKSNKLRTGHAFFQYILSLFPKLSLSLEIFTLDLEALRIFMPLVKTVKLDEVRLIRHGGITSDDLLRCVLNECRNANTLLISCETSTSFEYEVWSPPFTCNYLHVDFTRWVTRDHIMNLFLTCTRVKLDYKSFDDEDLKAIFEKWIDESPTESLEMHANDGSYRGKTLTNVFGHLPGAHVVRKAKLHLYGLGLDVAGFREGRCYQIQQRSGKKALVYQLDHYVELTTKFEIDDSIDRMAVELEENEEGRWRHIE